MRLTASIAQLAIRTVSARGAAVGPGRIVARPAPTGPKTT